MAINQFNSKYFNAEVFGKYQETVPRVKQNALLKAGILRPRNEIKSMFADQVGGNYASVPMVGLIGGTPDNYDGVQNLTEDGIGTFMQSMIVVGRMHGWTEKDFTYELTHKDFMAEIAKQTTSYWDDVDQATILAILDGIFASTDTNATAFKNAHTYDITEATESKVGATTLNSAIQKAAGANKGIFTAAIMHSAVATNLENLQILEYCKSTDSKGMERETGMATWNGRTVIIDDDVPVNDGVYTTYILGQGAFDYVDCGAKVPSEMFRDPKTNGGKDTLYMRQRKLFAPRGISFKQPETAIVSPTDAQLKAGANWAMVTGTDSAVYDHKAIPIVQIKSLG